MDAWMAPIGFGTLLVTVAGFGVALVMLVRSMRKSNDAAHAKTGQHVRDLRGEVQALDAKNEAAHAGIVERIDTSLYKAGAGVPHDDLEAVRWFRLAADQGRVLLFVLFAVVPLASVSARLQPPAPPAGTFFRSGPGAGTFPASLPLRVSSHRRHFADP